MLQVDHASHFDGGITQRYPTGTEFVGPCAQIDQVVVSACAVVLVLLRTDDLKERFCSRKDGLKESTMEVQNDVSIKEPLQPEVAVLSILFPQLLHREARIGRLKPAQSLRYHFQCIAIADQWLDERSHAIVFLSKGTRANPAN